jgi:hypothetical protein
MILGQLNRFSANGTDENVEQVLTDCHAPPSGKPQFSRGLHSSDFARSPGPSSGTRVPALKPDRSRPIAG